MYEYHIMLSCYAAPPTNSLWSVWLCWRAWIVYWSRHIECFTFIMIEMVRGSWCLCALRGELGMRALSFSYILILSVLSSLHTHTLCITRSQRMLISSANRSGKNELNTFEGSQMKQEILPILQYRHDADSSRSPRVYLISALVPFLVQVWTKNEHLRSQTLRVLIFQFVSISATM